MQIWACREWSDSAYVTPRYDTPPATPMRNAINCIRDTDMKRRKKWWNLRTSYSLMGSTGFTAGVPCRGPDRRISVLLWSSWLIFKSCLMLLRTGRLFRHAGLSVADFCCLFRTVVKQFSYLRSVRRTLNPSPQPDFFKNFGDKDCIFAVIEQNTAIM